MIRKAGGCADAMALTRRTRVRMVMMVVMEGDKEADAVGSDARRHKVEQEVTTEKPVAM